MLQCCNSFCLRKELGDKVKVGITTTAIKRKEGRKRKEREGRKELKVPSHPPPPPLYVSFLVGCTPQGRYSRFQAGDHRMRAKIKSQKYPKVFPGPKLTLKNLMPNLWTLKISRKDCILFADLLGRDTRAPSPRKVDLNTQKNTWLNQVTHTRWMLDKFPYPKKNSKSKISNDKNPSINPVTWNLQYPPTPTPLPVHLPPSPILQVHTALIWSSLLKVFRGFSLFLLNAFQ